MSEYEAMMAFIDAQAPKFKQYVTMLFDGLNKDIGVYVPAPIIQKDLDGTLSLVWNGSNCVAELTISEDDTMSWFAKANGHLPDGSFNYECATYYPSGRFLYYLKLWITENSKSAT